MKVALGAATSAPMRVGAEILQGGEDSFYCSAIDTTNGYIYLGTNTSPGRIIKVALGINGGLPHRVGALTLNEGEENLDSAVIDSEAGFAYFGTGTSPGIVVKVALGAGDTPPSRVGAVTLETGENYLHSSVIDPAAGYAWFGTSTSPGQVVKVNLGPGDRAPFRVNAETLDSEEDYLSGAVIDPDAGYAYFGTLNDRGIIVKVALGSGNHRPNRIGAVTVGDTDQIRCGAIDTSAGYAYFGSEDSADKYYVSKVALGTGEAPPSFVGKVSLQRYEGPLSAVALLPNEGYFGSSSRLGGVVRVGLSLDGSPPIRVGNAQMPSLDENKLQTATIDPAAGYAYFAGGSFPGFVVKVGLHQRGSLRATRILLSEAASVASVAFYSYAADGNSRLAIYNDHAPQMLLWESPSVSNTVSNGWLTYPISSGSPAALTLQPGSHWLAWEVDAGSDVPSYTKGNPGDGFKLAADYGPFPALLEGDKSPTLTDETWSEYITYDPAVDNAQIVSTTIPPKVPPNISFSAGITVRNTGNTVWPTDGTYLLKTTSDECGLIENPAGIAPADPAYPNDLYQFIARVNTPPTERACSVQFQMTGPGSAPLGDPFTATITIAQPPNSSHDWSNYE